MDERHAVDIDTTTKRMHNLGKTLSVLCSVAVFIFSLLALLSMVGALLSLFLPDTVSKLTEIFQSNEVFRQLNAAADLSSMEPKYVGAISCTVSALTFFALSFYARSFKRLLASLIESERPFTAGLAHQIRRTSLSILFVVPYNPVAGVFILLVTILFSYLVDYGAFLQEKADETGRIQGEMILSFAEITENKSGQTGQHVRRVAEYTRVLASALGMDNADEISLASTMHDIGKLMIPAEILEKPARLTDEEYEIIKTHTTYGGKLLEGVEGEEMALARTIALQHHERPDGRGYPEGLTGEQISSEARIVAVADVYDALTSKRSYKDAWEDGRAYSEIVKGSGTQFDSKVVEAFKSSYDEIVAIQRRFAD